jgi:hypothetical protein
MLQTLMWMDKITALHWVFLDCGMMFGTTSSYMAGIQAGESPTVAPASSGVVDGEDDKDDDNEGPESSDPVSGSLSVVKLATRSHMSDFISGSCRHSNPNFK